MILPIDITFSHYRSQKTILILQLINRSCPGNSHIKKIKDYVKEKFHQTALNHLKNK